MNHGTPDGTNSLKKPRPCLAKPMTSTSRMVITPKVAVTAICEVAVKAEEQAQEVHRQDEGEDGEDEREQLACRRGR